MQPEYFSNYLNVIFYSTSNEYYKNLGSGIGIIGLLDGLLNIFHSQHNNILISKIFWFLLAIIISITYLLNSKKNKKLNIINGILITNLLNPYLMNYDLYICIPCLIYLINKNLFFKNLKYNEYFCYFSLIFIIIVHDKFAPLLLSTLFLFIILRNSFFEKKLINT